MSVIHHIGDVFESDADVIAHQVNVFGRMGAGIALTIRNMYPHVYKQYQEYCRSFRYSNEKLLGKVQFTNSLGKYEIANAFSQRDWDTDYNALEKCFTTLCEVVRSENIKLAIPDHYGCGLGGGNWANVLLTLDKIFTDVDIHIYRLEK